MRLHKRNHLKKISGFLALAVCGLLGTGAGAVSEIAVPVYAESGTVYTCTVNRSYSHPVTGVIEDSGGEASYTTGQGMVEGAVYGDGILEVTDSGGYYLTIRMSLMDYTSNQTFAVQNVGDSGWSSTGTAVTATGSDSNGTTADVCIQVPSENSIVRIGMYVTPMGRDVIFYVYPTNYSEGNSVGMTPAFVTEASGSGADASGTDTYEGDGSTTLTTDNTADAQEQSTEEEQQAADQQTTDQEESQSQDTSEEETKSQAAKLQASVLENKDSQTAQESQESSDSDSELNNAQGLNLSTAEEVSEDTDETSGSISLNPYVMLGLTIVVSGLILIGAAALVIWYFHKNWRRWGREDDEDDE